MVEEFLMTRKEVCKYLGISLSSLERLEQTRKLRPIRRLEGGKKLYSSEDVYAYLKSIWTGGNR